MYGMKILIVLLLTAGGEPPVDPLTAETIARARVEAQWGGFQELVSRGTFYELDGQISAYYFQYSKGRERAYAVVSADRNSVPVPEFGRGSPFFLEKMPAYRQMAAGILGGPAELDRIIYVSPFEVYLAFRRGGERILIDALALLHGREDELVRIRRKEPLRENRRTRAYWETLIERVREGSAREFFQARKSENKIEGVPFYIWSYGCSPTASAMVLGFWDKNGYGRFVDYRFDHWDVVIAGACDTGWIYNVPNVQRELAIAMETDTTSGGTYIDMIAPGQSQVASENGYDFDSEDFWGDETNGWEFDVVKNEIDYGRPFNWGAMNYYYIGPHHGFIDTMTIYHSVTAVGYLDGGNYENDYVLVHDTWSSIERYWALYTFHDGEYSYSSVATFVPSTPPTSIVTLLHPFDGDAFFAGDTLLLRWITSAACITRVNLYYTPDDGQEWIPIAEELPASRETLTFVFPDIASERWRFQVKGFNASGDYVDGYTSGDNIFLYDGEMGGIDTLFYENYSPFYVEPVESTGFDLPSVRFTAPDSLSLLGARFLFHAKRGSGWILRVLVFRDQNGFPGDTLGYVDLPEDEVNTREEGTGWTYVDLTPVKAMFPRGCEFHIGCTVLGCSMDSLLLTADYGNSKRSSVYRNGSFVSLDSLLGLGKNFFIEAVVEYGYVLAAENDSKTAGQSTPNLGRVLKLSLEALNGVPTRIGLYNTAGRLVRELEISPLKKEVSLDLEGLPRGSYLYRIEGKDGVISSGRFLLLY